MEVALAAPEPTAGRKDVLRRACDFGEAMLKASDAAVHDLCILQLAALVGGDRHCRFWDEAWVVDALMPQRELILAALRGEPRTLLRPA